MLSNRARENFLTEKIRMVMVCGKARREKMKLI